MSREVQIDRWFLARRTMCSCGHNWGIHHHNLGCLGQCPCVQFDPVFEEE